MSRSTCIAIGVVCLTLYNLAVLIGTGYVVFGLGHSGWWFVVTLLLLRDFKAKDDEQ